MSNVGGVETKTKIVQRGCLGALAVGMLALGEIWVANFALSNTLISDLDPIPKMIAMGCEFVVFSQAFLYTCQQALYLGRDAMQELPKQPAETKKGLPNPEN